MDEIRKRLEGELSHTLNRIRRMGGAVVLEELQGAVGDNSPFADEVDLIQVNENREMSFATRSVLIERAGANEGDAHETTCHGRCPRSRPVSAARIASSG